MDRNFNYLLFSPTFCNKIACIFLGYILITYPELTRICTVSSKVHGSLYNVSFLLYVCISADKILNVKYIFVSKLPTQDAVWTLNTVNGVG